MELSRLSAGDVEGARQSPPKRILSEQKQEDGKQTGGIPHLRRDDTFDRFDTGRAPKMGEAFRRCLAVSSGNAWCAFLWGRILGSGKTHLAIAAAIRYPSSMFWKVPDFLAFLRAHLAVDMENKGVGSEVETILKAYQSANFLLVLDDLGVENQTDWANEQLYRVLDGRYENRAPTIITSNAPLDSLDPRIRSRFREGWVVCEGKDLR